MNTFKEENPIMYRIDQMRKNWEDHVCDNTQLVRWVLLKDEVRMLKAFSLLEASEYGQIPDFFINFDVPFSSVERYGYDLLTSWLEIWNNPDARAEVADANVLPDWDDTPYQDAEVKGSETTFLHAMSSFAKSISANQQLVLNVVPAGYKGAPAFTEWILKCLETFPENLRLMVFDLKEAPKFHEVPMHFKVCTLVADLNMHEATKEIIQQGDMNDPSAGVNLCLLNIAEATNEKDEEKIHHWGKEGLEIAEKTGLKSIVATVYLAYGAAFYQLKKTDRAMDLFKAAEEQAIQGNREEDIAVAAILLQAYNFQAAVCLYGKKYEEARDRFLCAAKEAHTQKNGAMYIEAKRQASAMSEKLYDANNAYVLLSETYEEYKSADKLYVKFTSMLLICNKLYNYAFDHKNKQLMDEIEEYATEIWGEHWKDVSQEEVYQTILATE